MPFSRGPRVDVVVLGRRDPSHPASGGSERWVHRVTQDLAARGLDVVLVCAAHDHAPGEEVVDGVRLRRRGGPLSVHAHALVEVVRLRPRLVLDVHDGLPFLSPMVRRGPVVVVVHHVHREQWSWLAGRCARSLGWWLESRLAPRVYRRCRYVTVSETSASELGELGVSRERITVVHNGTEPVPDGPRGPREGRRLIVISRLVAHKRIEHALLALRDLRREHPGLCLDVVGEGPHGDVLRRRTAQWGLSGAVRFHGHVDETTKHHLLARADLHLCPSVKEGWGLAVMEAATHGIPTVAYRAAGGVRESVRDGETGLLAEGLADFVDRVGRVLADTMTRRRMGTAAVEHAARFDWETSRARLRAVLDAAAPHPAFSDARTPGPPVRRIRPVESA